MTVKKLNHLVIKAMEAALMAKEAAFPHLSLADEGGDRMTLHESSHKPPRVARGRYIEKNMRKTMILTKKAY